MKNIVVLSGAGISAESGISTFRGANGLWQNHDITRVASPSGWSENPQLVLDFYNYRRRQLLNVQPNAAHHALVRLEEKFHVDIITQNVDDLHERAGSSRVLHLHGELLKSRSTLNPRLVYPCHDDIKLGDCCAEGAQLRPHIVWFGESVPLLTDAAALVKKADSLIIIGTSLQVYPAAGLLAYARTHAAVFYIDVNPGNSAELSDLSNLTIYQDQASKAVPELVNSLLEEV